MIGRVLCYYRCSWKRWDKGAVKTDITVPMIKVPDVF